MPKYGASAWATKTFRMDDDKSLRLGTGVRYVGENWSGGVVRTPSYTLVDLDVRWTITQNPFGKDVALQLNVTNLFDEYYIGFFGGTLDDFGFAQIGAPRAASLSLIFGY